MKNNLHRSNLLFTFEKHLKFLTMKTDKKTAVEYLVDRLEVLTGLRLRDEIIVDKAKAMERQQIIEAHGDKKKLKSNPDSIVTYGYTYTGEMYFNDNFNTNK